MNFLRHIVARETVKLALRGLLHWPPLRHPKPGYSIIIATPWDLRHLLPVNLRFVSATDLENVDAIHVVFDRTERPGAEEVMQRVREEFADLPIRFHFLEPLSGRLICRVAISAFFHATCCIVGLKACETRYAVLHDFDLFPLSKDYFKTIFEMLERGRLRFAGVERTHYDGLTDEDNVLGTWGLGVDVGWLRARYSPVACYHRTRKYRGRYVHLDPFSQLELNTPERALVPGHGGDTFCHAMNLCSTYLCYIQGKNPHVAWRLHYLWYLEHLAGRSQPMMKAAAAMESASSSRLVVGDYAAELDGVHWTCANVLRDEVTRMERALWGACRPEVERFLAATDGFLRRYGLEGPDAESSSAAAPSGTHAV